MCSTNHKEDFILETTDMPDELVREVGGKIVFEDVQPMVSLIRLSVEEDCHSVTKFCTLALKTWLSEVY